MHILTHGNTYSCTHLLMYTLTHVHTYSCTHSCTHLLMNTLTHVYTYSCTHLLMNTLTHAHTHVHTYWCTHYSWTHLLMHTLSHAYSGLVMQALTHVCDSREELEGADPEALVEPPNTLCQEYLAEGIKCSTVHTWVSLHLPCWIQLMLYQYYY